MLNCMAFDHIWGWGVLHKNVSQILAIINFSSREIVAKTLSVRKNIMDNINRGKTSHLNLDKCGIRDDISDCRLALFA